MTTNTQATPSFAVHIPDAELEPEPWTRLRSSPVIRW